MPSKQNIIDPNSPMSKKSNISSEKTNEIPIRPIIAPITVLSRGYSLKISALLKMFIEIIVEKKTAIKPVFNPEPAAL